MYLIFFLIWIIFNGQFTLEIAAFGVVIAGLVYWFICKFLNYSPKTDIALAKKLFEVLHYIFVLIVEIMKANFAVVKMIMSSKYEIEPVVVKFKTNLKTRPARILLANSITLTPGTITVSLSDDEYVVHCLDKSLAQGIDSSIFVELLEKMEEKNRHSS
ncbi:sodium:proton antiporter [Parablautia intestinalis]|uniref:Sodium:proton antiporter n=1 Tax=Parablautia intestinalis TaxID=2320100 RepID=A0A3A9AKS2_9FIRM|nr:Na+/H+ antiporter subunit E [Parablautia intestinalis]MCI8615211.1 Na+/H+ antiporter subunit E [Lachnospiraceae bacterium]MDE7048206.1 Na+/H+ antiporter subunit E [Lachnospiraceae bacterium]RKI91987.1 sodium:proton antiporter [Parablautia intestinalis]